MINQIYRLVASRRFEIAYSERSLQSGDLVIRPTHLSICAADQRYYTGSRAKEVLQRKLPMALIHEGIGKVVYDPSGNLRVGTPVVMIPNVPVEHDEVIAENYLRSSQFCSSSRDGFMQDYVFLNHDRVVPIIERMNPHVAAFTELVSVGMHALARFENKAHARRWALGVWGDGNLGFIMALILRHRYPDSRIYVFGKTDHKLDHFSFVDETYRIDEIPPDLLIDHAFECVGGMNSQSAINQIIDCIRPEGCIAILGVSEYPIEINTRMVLEKGITIVGSSRSGRADFVNTMEFLGQYPDVIDYLETLVGTVCEVRTIQDIVGAFEKDLTTSWGKTIMQWQI
jgi:ribitol-5-phosphate 2-dehydrogenase